MLAVKAEEFLHESLEPVRIVVLQTFAFFLGHSAVSSRTEWKVASIRMAPRN